jgi:hypothetical protein
MSTSVNWRKRGIELTCVLRAWNDAVASSKVIGLF